MQTELYLPPDQIVDIIDQVEAETDVLSESGVAHAPDFNQVKAQCDHLWGEIKTAIADVAEKGKDRIQQWMDHLRGLMQSVRQELGDRSSAVFAEIRQRIRLASHRIQSALLDLLPPSVTLGKTNAGLTEVGLEYQLAVGNGIEAGLQWVLQMTAGGTLSVSAQYIVRQP